MTDLAVIAIVCVGVILAAGLAFAILMMVSKEAEEDG